MENQIVDEATDSLKIEVVSEIAQYLLEQNSKGEDIYLTDEEGNTLYTPSAQKRFDELYDMWFDNIIALQIKKKETFLAIDADILSFYPYENFKTVLPNHELLTVLPSFLFLRIL